MIDQATLENEIVEGIARAEEGIGSGQVPFLLAERPRSECARSMRAVKGSLGHSSMWVNGVKRGLGLSVSCARATRGRGLPSLGSMDVSACQWVGG
jgi:hypothetical protein